MELLERDAPLHNLGAALNDAVAGEGRVALVSGEAGIGKTSLVERFTRIHRGSIRVLWGACDSLFTPRPLGPLHDIARQIEGPLIQLLDSEADRTALFSACLSEFQREAIIVVMEDVHWADEATLDLLKYLGRRIQRTRALLIVTYRDDEIGPQHPLRSVLGDLATSAAPRRIVLPPLSVNAVRALVGERPLDAVALHRQTDGNPFFVTEVLASGISGVPSTVRDAVLARAARLSPSARAVLEAAAVIGARIEPWLLSDVTGAEAKAAEECLAIGVILTEGDTLAFRHELARQTILEAISPQQKIVLHRLVLEALKSSPATRHDLARLAHHAEGAGDREAVLAYAPSAARQAAKLNAHREAAAQYVLALRFADDLSQKDRALLLEAYAWECGLIEQPHEGIVARRAAHEVWQAVGNRLKAGENLARLSYLLALAEQITEAEQVSRAAIEALEALPPGPELALAYRCQAVLRLIYEDDAEAIFWGEKAIALAERFQHMETLASAYNSLGTATLFSDYERGCALLERSLSIAREAGLDSYVAYAYMNLGNCSVELHEFQRADHYLAEGILYSTERDMDTWHFYMLAYQALSNFYQGHWAEASETASAIVQRPNTLVHSRVHALRALGRLRARRGDPGADTVLTEAMQKASNVLNHIGPVRAARAEAAWLAGDRDRTLAEARAAYDVAVSKQHAWIAGELAFWRWRAGDDITPPPWIARPFALQIAADWRGAAEEWGRLDCPYEQAMALMDGDEAAQLAALEIFEHLGARPAAEIVRQKLQAIPARRLEKEKYGGLTAREREVAALIAQGRSNREIAEAMVVGARTVETYVTRILSKLGFNSRVQIATWAVEKNLTRPDRS